MKKTIGKNTIGDNNKMNVNLKEYNRSTHDLSFKILNTQAPGTLVPLYKRVVLPGDKIELDTDVSILTHPTVGPLFGSFKWQMDYFFVPLRLYNSWLHNNRLTIGLDMSQIKLPVMSITAGDGEEFSHSSLISYLGIKGVGTSTGAGVNITRKFNAVPYLGYWDIYKNYYANTQEPNGMFVNTGGVTGARYDGTGKVITSSGLFTVPVKLETGKRLEWAPSSLSAGGVFFTIDGVRVIASSVITGFSTIGSYSGGTIVSAYNNKILEGVDVSLGIVTTTFPLENIDKMRDEILISPGNVALEINTAGGGIVPYNGVGSMTGGGSNNGRVQRHLALKTYNSDLFNNWIRTAWIEGANGINAVSAISTTLGSFTMDQLNLSKKVYDMLNRIAVSGGTYNDWIETIYTTDYFQRAEIPVFIGGMSSEVTFQEVINTSASENQPLGTLAGKGRSQGKKGGRVRFKVDEPGYIMGISSLTPRIVYSQGNDWDMYSLQTLNDLHKPALDGIGYQDLITEQMHFASSVVNMTTGFTTQKSAGKQPAWLNYMTDVDKAAGNFAETNNEMFMTLNRRYSIQAGQSGTITDLTTYIIPDKFNYAFAQTDISAMNFWVHVGIKDIERRVISAKQIPVM